jgi:hypothetical protein
MDECLRSNNESYVYDGHYIALVDGELKCDKVLKNQKCNVKPLTAKNVSSMFYRKSTSPIFVWNVEL